jgi:uncharacterized membrane protein YbaN (DUF454 family)
LRNGIIIFLVGDCSSIQGIVGVILACLPTLS